MKEVTRHIVMYPDCNATQNLFGGRLLSWIDEAAAMYAMCQLNSKHIVTANFGGLDFKVPVPLGSVVSLKCNTVAVGRKSITIDTECIIRKFDTGEDILAAKNTCVFVNVDSTGKPKLIADNVV